MSAVSTLSLAQTLSDLPGAQAHRAQALLAAPIERVHTDTRSLRPGDCFVALRGERFDAHDFLAQAQAAGAVAVLAERGVAASGLPGVEVADSRAALGLWARAWRARFDLPLIAVTGSNGKTTVTQMIAAILRAAVGDSPDRSALATQGNFNNDIGVPLTVLRLRPSHRLAVVELGMNHPGEIAGLAAIAQPRVALVNNAQREHQEFMATVEAVARENGAVIDALPADGVAVFPAGDPHTGLWRSLAGDRTCWTFSDDLAVPADLHAQAEWLGDAWRWRAQTPAGEVEAHLRIAGRHNVRNALAATACALAAGVSLDAVARGLSAFEPVQGRSRALSLARPNGPLTLVDDTYNANPDSVRAAVNVLAELPGPRLLVLGDMGEVGEQGLAFHLEVLRHARERGIERVLVTGEWMAQAVAVLAAEADAVPQTLPRYLATMDDLLEQVRTEVSPCASVLVKGSRFMKMERVVVALQSWASGAAAATAQGVSHVA